MFLPNVLIVNNLMKVLDRMLGIFFGEDLILKKDERKEWIKER